MKINNKYLLGVLMILPFLWACKKNDEKIEIGRAHV